MLVCLRTNLLAPATLAKNYRLLHTVLASAVTEEQIARNPCAIPEASAESSAERPVISVQDVFAIADTIAPRYRSLVLLATFCGLRFGELAGLTRADLDLATGSVRVERDLDELDDGRLQPGRVKSNASRRTVTIPAILIDDVRQHLSRYAEAGPAGALFIGAHGGRLRRSNFRTQHRIPTVTALGLEHVRFHDLRHTGNTLAAATGASTRELMRRLGHASTRAAMIYQHATLERDTAIAEQLSELITHARGLPSRD